MKKYDNVKGAVFERSCELIDEVCDAVGNMCMARDQYILDSCVDTAFNSLFTLYRFRSLLLSAAEGEKKRKGDDRK